MHKTYLIRMAGFLSALLLLPGNIVWAQQLAKRPQQATMRNLAYDATQEKVIEGTVLSYSAVAPTPPIGPRVQFQTASATMDVHLGAPSYLAANHFNLPKGDPVRFVVAISAHRQRPTFPCLLS